MNREVGLTSLERVTILRQRALNQNSNQQTSGQASTLTLWKRAEQ